MPACRLAAVVLVSAMLAGGCGSSSNRTSRSTVSTTPLATATVSTATTLAPAASTPPPATEQPTATVTRAASRQRRPTIVRRLIPFGAKRKREMAAYSKRHYGVAEYRLRHPRVIVEHYTVTDSFRATYDTFAPDVPDVELHELPNVCSQFVVDSDGTIYELVPLALRCRHTVGLDDRSIGIEHVGNSDQDILGRPAQLRASLRLTSWLRCRYKIAVKNVIGHSESLTSPYHHELVASLKSQTHDDWTKADMDVYRRKLRARGSCG